MNLEDRQVIDRLRTLLDSAEQDRGLSRTTSAPCNATDRTTWSTARDTDISAKVGIAAESSQLEAPVESAESPLHFVASAHCASEQPSGPGISADSSGPENELAPLQVSLDVGVNLDPIDLGLISEEDAASLFAL